ncbi:MAG: adenylate/guanylate cyclase domain-containing protein [Geminicoccaceae bacterium]
MERRLAAILCADVVGYSRLMGKDEAGTRALLRVFAAEHALPLVARHGGQVVKTMGDGWLVAFASVVAAVECGLAWQAAATAPLCFRIGVHLGDVIVEEGDLFGDGVNVAARLEALAAGVTETLATALAHFEDFELIDPGGAKALVAAADLAAEDMGERTLKNIALPMRVFHIAAADGAAAGVSRPWRSAATVCRRFSSPRSGRLGQAVRMPRRWQPG